MKVRLAAVLGAILAGLAVACAPSADAPESLPTRPTTATRTAASTPAPTATIPGTATATAGDAATVATAATPTPALLSGGPSITISAVGDISLARQVNDWMAQYGATYPYELIRHLLTGDIVFGNLEGALTDSGEPWPKAFNFRTPPQYAPGLATAGFDVVALANNHAMDFGLQGLQDTIAALDTAGVAHAGSGEGGFAARRAAVIERQGLRTAFIACVSTPAEGSGFTIDVWGAGEGPGLFVCSPFEIGLAVDEARAGGADFVVLSIHAGDEYVNAPNGTQVALVEAALAAGVDLVLGHHAHVVQPVEQRGSRLIAWGLSNFIFDLDQWDLAGVPEPRVSPILHVTLTKGVGVTSWRADAVLLDADTDRPRPATPEEAAVLESLLAP